MKFDAYMTKGDRRRVVCVRRRYTNEVEKRFPGWRVSYWGGHFRSFHDLANPECGEGYKGEVA